MLWGGNYPTLQQIEFAAAVSVALNFAAPIVAYMYSRRLTRYRWWPHVIACLWVIVSVPIWDVLAQPQLGPEETSIGDTLKIFPTVLSIVFILFGYCVVGLGLLVRFIFQKVKMTHAR
jgi:hypothetical protein